MRIIDGDELAMWLSKWMISSFGTEPTEETKAIKVVCDAVGDMVKELERGKKGVGLIRRQDAIDAMVAEVDRIIDNICIQNVTEARLRDAVNRLPSAEPKRPSGKWLSHNDYCKRHGYIPSGLIAFWWCDQCEQGTNYSTNFCPNCGADMRGVGDGR